MNAVPSTVVAIPMKDPGLAKSRLAPALGPQQRERLAIALFERTLDFFARAMPGMSLLVVSASARIAELCEQHRVQLLREDAPQGLNVAAQRAAAWAQQQGYARLVIVPADIPVLLREEVEGVLKLADSAEMVIAEARDGGTNMLVLSPPRAIEFQYGLDSARRHEQQAKNAGMRVCRHYLPFLGHDLDTPADCLVLAERSRRRRSPLRHAQQTGAAS